MPPIFNNTTISYSGKSLPLFVAPTVIRVMGATGNREYTVFSTKYWTLRILMIIMFESHSLQPNFIMDSITGRHFYFIMLNSSCIMKQNLHVKIETARFIINANKCV